MSRTRARFLRSSIFAAAAFAAGCQGDTNDIFATGSGGDSAGGAGATSTSTKSSSVATTSVGTTTSAATTTTSAATTTVASTSAGAMCGNGMAEAGEQCDGTDLNGQTCQDLGYPSGELACFGCQFDTMGCNVAACNGVLEPGEDCDGNNLNGADCTNFGFGNPAGLKCVNCAYDSSGCKPTCGNNIIELGESCDDGNTANGDGCTSMCSVEMTTGNGVSCMTPIAISLSLGSQSTGNTTVGGGMHNNQGCPAAGPDRVYAITPTAKGFVTATLPRVNATVDNVLWVSNQCNANQLPQLLCNDTYDGATGQGLNGGEIVSFPVNAGQTYYLFVDTYGNTGGNYALHLDLSVGTCADPIPIALEAGTGQTFLGTNVGQPVTSQGSCGGQPGGEVVYAVSPLFTDSIQVQTDTALTNFNPVLYARPACGDAAGELACSNQNGTGQETINYNGVMGGTVFVKVDGSQIGGGTESGNYGIEMTP